MTTSNLTSKIRVKLGQNIIQVEVVIENILPNKSVPTLVVHHTHPNKKRKSHFLQAFYIFFKQVYNSFA